MKIICAGYPKTGSKSCSTALRSLGYKVADYMETLEFLNEIWRAYLNGEATIEAVLEEYEKHGFDANQDLPGNLKWEELYNGSPKGTKVILTVRDSDDIWWKSWSGFMKQEISRDSIGDFNKGRLFQMFASTGYLGPHLKASVPQ